MPGSTPVLRTALTVDASRQRSFPIGSKKSGCSVGCNTHSMVFCGPGSREKSGQARLTGHNAAHPQQPDGRSRISRTGRHRRDGWAVRLARSRHMSSSGQTGRQLEKRHNFAPRNQAQSDAAPSSQDQPSRPAKPIRSGTLERFEPSPTAVSVVMGRLHTPPPQLISPGVIQLRQTPGSKPDSRGDAASRIGWPKQRRRSGRATQANAAACKALSARRAVRDFSSGLARLAGLGCLREGLFVLSELPGRLPAER